MNEFNLSEHSIISWLYREGIKTETGDPLDLRDHYFLFDIYRDLAPKQVIYKAAQIGFTTLAILKTFWLAKHRGMDMIYTLPTDNDVKSFAGGKVNRIISNNPVLQRWVKDKDTVEQKKVGGNVIYYRGTWGERAALMITSDLNIHDEEDRSKQAIIAQYASRLQHSEYKWEWHFSNPSVEGNGVSKYWKLSDQKHWFITCKACHKEQYMSFPDSIDIVRQVYQCKECKATIDTETRRTGRWVAKYKDREWSGYWIPLMIAPWVSAKDILEYKETKSPEYFANFVLGIPYVGEGNKVTPEMLWRNLTSEINSQEEVVIGCDSGLKKHYVLGNKEGLFYYGVTETWADIESLLKKYKRSIAIIDALPDLTEPRKLREKYPGRVFLVYYVRDKKTMQLIKWGKDAESGNINVDRNRLIQFVVDEFADQRIPLQGNQEEWEKYYAHWETMYRVNEWEEAERLGKINYVYTNPFRWESSTGQDHWVHATCYWRVGMERFGRGKAVMFSGEKLNLPESQPIRPDNTMIAPDPRKIFALPSKEEDWRNI